MPGRGAVGSGIQSPHTHHPEPAGRVTRNVMRKPGSRPHGKQIVSNLAQPRLLFPDEKRTVIGKIR